MSISRKILTVAAPAAMLLLGACATPFKADVSRFQMMPAPEGQTFAIRPANPRNSGGIEFNQYASLVAARLAEQGYRPVEAGPATLLVTLDYGVDNGHEKVVSTPGFGWGGYGGGFGGGWGYGGFRRPFYGRGWYSGWADPFWYQPFGGNQVDSYTYFVSYMDLKIRRTGDERVLFEGRAKARSTDDSLQRLVPNLIEAMFTGFPGRSGEEVLITVPPPPKPGEKAAPPTVQPQRKSMNDGV